MIKFLFIFFIILNVFADNNNFNSLLKSTKSLNGQFTQEVIDQNGRLIQKVSGEVLFKKPNFFRWSYITPFKSEVVSDGKLLYLYDPDLKQVVISPLDKIGGVSPAMLLVMSDINLAFNTDSVKGSDGMLWYRSVPKDKESAFFKEVYINYNDSKLNAMKIIDNFDNQTNIFFKNILQNVEIDNAMFLFNMPDGIDVIKN